MNILNILKYPNKMLNTKSEDVIELTEQVKNIINDMKDTMIFNKGLGLAAIQIGIKKKILIVNTLNDNNEILVIINPKIIYQNKTHTYKEGCLSFPDIFVDIQRKKIIKITFLSLDKKNKIIKANNLLSICIQHEIDHLNGITLYEKASKLKRNIIIKKTK